MAETPFNQIKTGLLRTQAEKDFRALSRRQEAILDAIPDILMEVDKNKVYTWANPAGFQFFGEDVIGKEAAFYFEGGNDIYDQVKPLFEGIKDTTYVESWQRRKDGEKRLLAWQCRALKNSEGNVTGALSSAQDITERKQTEQALRESEDKFKYIFDHSAIGISVTRPSGEIDVNQAVCEMLGYSIEELDARKWQEMTYPDDIESTHNVINSLLSGGKTSARFTKRYIHKNGSIVWTEVSTALRRDKDGNPLYFITAVNDITERKQAENELRENERRLASIYNTVGDSIFQLKVEEDCYRFSSVNHAFLATTGLTSAQVIGRRVDEVIPEPSLSMVLRIYAAAIREKKIVRWEEASEYPTGRLTGEVSIAPVIDESGHCTYLVGAVHDITKRKEAEEALRESEQKYRMLADHVDDIVWHMDMSMRFTYTSPSVERVFGYTVDEVCRLRASDLLDKSGIEQMQKVIQEHLSVAGKKASKPNEYLMKHKDGHWIPVEVISSPVFDIEGRPTGLVGIARDITESKQVKEKLVAEKLLLRTLIDHLPDRIFVMDDQGRKIVSNTSDWQASGGKKMEDVIGKTDLETYPPELAGQYWALDKKVIDSGMPIINQEEPGLDSRGNPVWILSSKVPLRDGSGRVVGLVGIGRDITERKQVEEEVYRLNVELEQRVEERTHDLLEAQEQLVRKEKLAVLGQLAGGVGHELRNPLSVILNAVGFLKLVQPDAETRIREYHSMIEQEVRNAEKIINDLLDFARIQSVDRESADVPELVQHVLNRFPAPESVNVALKFPTDLPKVYIDPRQVEQVLGNLVVNACQAMPDGGKLTITAHQKKDQVAVVVKDAGAGITPENMQKIFEPLFTTKAKGIGLGLAVSRKLVEANGGRIDVQSEPGKGSVFTVYLPVK